MPDSSVVSRPASGSATPSCCVLILNYNGRRHLEFAIPSALAAAARLGSPAPVVVVDNRSTEDDVAFVRDRYPEVTTVIATANDYLFSLNEVVSKRTEDIVVILNNDMRFDEEFISVMLPHFSDPAVFAVSAKVFDWEGRRLTTGQRTAEIRHCWFYKEWNPEPTVATPTLDAGGGYAAFRRSMFVELGGFNRLYRPAYWEDTDLSYRAWRRGWRVLYEPRSVIFHRVGASWASTKGGQPKVDRLIRRNEVLFAIRNVGDWRFLLGFMLLLPVRIWKNALRGNYSHVTGALLSLPRWPAALSQRWSDSSRSRGDEKFLAEIRQSSVGRGASSRLPAGKEAGALDR